MAAGGQQQQAAVAHAVAAAQTHAGEVSAYAAQTAELAAELAVAAASAAAASAQQLQQTPVEVSAYAPPVASPPSEAADGDEFVHVTNQ